MSLDTVKLWRQRNFAFNVETTTGTPATVGATQATNNCFNPKIKFNTEKVDRDSQGSSLSPILQGLGARAAACQVETELVGNGAAGDPPWATLLGYCGMLDNSTVGTFVPVSGSNKTATMSTWQSGRQKIMSGCMGSFKLSLKRGQKGRFMWNFMGVAQPVVDAANPTPTYVTTKAPRVGAATFTVGGITLRCDDIEIDKGNIVFLREDVTALDSNGDPTGYRSAWIGGWKTVIRIKPESLPIATEDFYTLYKTAGTAALSIVVGTVTNNTFTITCPVLQLITDPDEEQRQELMVDSLEFLAERNSAAGDDDFSIVAS
jgi:hypothetical protein